MIKLTTKILNSKVTAETKKKILQFIYFVGGVILTLVLTKLFDRFIPNNPVVLKQITDTLKVVHIYNFPKNLSGDSSREELKKEIKNLELINNYDIQIKKRISQIQEPDGLSPNLIITHNEGDLSQNGYTYDSSSPYFTSDCPDLNGKYLDIKLNFFNSLIVKDILCLRLSVFRFKNLNKADADQLILEDFYKIRPENNFIRINNDFPRGKYEIIYGFMFKDQKKTLYPKFYQKKCIVVKN